MMEMINPARGIGLTLGLFIAKRRRLYSIKSGKKDRSEMTDSLA